mgnify:CR=1 FL=1
MLSFVGFEVDGYFLELGKPPGLHRFKHGVIEGVGEHKTFDAFQELDPVLFEKTGNAITSC